MARVTGIAAAVSEAARSAEQGQSAWESVPHYSVEARPSDGGGWALTLRHYGTIILDVTKAADGSLTSAIGPYWWGSRTDMSAIAKAHRALGMRRSIKRGRLVAY
jgi:hypothetical protein